MKKRTSLKTPSGFRDLSVSEAKLKNWLIKTVVEIYEKRGFLPIETPIVEFSETLTDEVSDFNLFNVNPSKERTEGEAQLLSLRFDQTVPLARYVIDHMSELSFPFKRYVCGPVFRGETPKAGRYRQFDQLDLDIVGASSLASDAEILLVLAEVMRAIVGKEKFKISVNSRTLLNTLPLVYSFDESLLQPVLIELDRRDKISRTELQKNLLDLGLSENAAEGLIEFGLIVGSPKDVVESIKKICIVIAGCLASKASSLLG